MNVFLTGASGFIGEAVARAFARAGHRVHGLTRSAEKGRRLAAEEILPVVGSMEEPAAWEGIARECEVLIHCAAEYSAQQWELDRSTMDRLIAASAAGRGRKVIYTGGCWVLGPTGSEAADETAPLAPPAFSVPRVAIEERILAASTSKVGTVVMRPGCVYGGSGSLTAMWFDGAAKNGAALVVGDGSNRWAMVHRDDLADLYLRVAESDAAGELFHAADPSRATAAECARAASAAVGAGGEVTFLPVADAVKMMGPFAECLVMDQQVDSTKAVRRLGWQPRHGGFVDGAEVYAAAWKASRG